MGAIIIIISKAYSSCLGCDGTVLEASCNFHCEKERSWWSSRPSLLDANVELMILKIIRCYNEEDSV